VIQHARKPVTILPRARARRLFDIVEPNQDRVGIAARRSLNRSLLAGQGASPQCVEQEA
jgi:hypothetical protein